MGRECHIIIAWIGEYNGEDEKISDYLKLNKYQETDIDPIGNRSFGGEDQCCEMVCMKSWNEEECHELIKFLRTLDWIAKESVHVLYAGSYSEDYTHMIIYRP